MPGKTPVVRSFFKGCAIFFQNRGDLDSILQKKCVALSRHLQNQNWQRTSKKCRHSTRWSRRCRLELDVDFRGSWRHFCGGGSVWIEIPGGPMRAQKPKMLWLTERPSPVILRFKRTARSWETFQKSRSRSKCHFKYSWTKCKWSQTRCYPSSDPTNSVTVYIHDFGMFLPFLWT